MIEIKKALLAEFFFSNPVYYRKNFRFAFTDLLLLFCGFWINPYRLCRKKGGGIYGETPFESWHRMASFLELKQEDVFYELGSGRGRGCFWLASFFPCRVVGVDKVTFFVRCASFFRSLFRYRNLQFLSLDFERGDFSEASHIYLYSTALSASQMAQIQKHFEKTLKPGTKILTVSAPFEESQKMVVQGSFPIEFVWGKTEAYLHEISSIC